MASPNLRVFSALALLIAPALFGGCLDQQISENQRQLQQQRAELDQLKREVAALQARQAQAGYPTTPPPPGSCDKDVMRAATDRGDAQFAAGNFSRALGYYQDAVTACPKDARAQLNVARAYEKLGNREQAIDYYRRASQADSPDESDATEQAKAALIRLGAAR